MISGSDGFSGSTAGIKKEEEIPVKNGFGV
jgi:hypothetical protein